MKKILLVVDLKDWAFAFTAREVKKRLHDYETDIWYAHGSRVPPNSLSSYDLVVPFTPHLHFDLTLSKAKVVCRIQSIREKNSYFGRVFLMQHFKAIGMVSQKLYDYYSTEHDNCYLVENGVDECLFAPDYDKRSESFVLGWAGRLDAHGKTKRAKEFLIPLCEKTSVELKTQIWTPATLFSHEQMPEFYNSISMYACCSLNEGEPLTVLEAMACGTPVISTRVGIVPEVVENGVNGFIVDSDEEFENKLIEVSKMSKDDLIDMGKKSRARILIDRTWDVRVDDFRKFIIENLD